MHCRILKSAVAFYLFLSLILIFSTSLVQAQGPTPNPKCDLQAVYAQLAAAKASGDQAKDLEALGKIRDAIYAAQTDCSAPKDVKLADRPRAPEGTGTRLKPIPFGSVVTLTQGKQKFTVAITNVKRGSEALDELKKGFANSTPEPGKEALLAYVEVLHLPESPEGVLKLSGGYFAVVSKAQRSNIMMFAGIAPSLSVEYFPGGTGGGWIVKWVYPDDPDPLLILLATNSGDKEVFFSTTPGK